MLFACSQLTDLTAFSNRFTSLSNNIGKLSYLKCLLINSNDITSSLPTEIGLLTGLTRLELPNNQFWSSVPSQIGALTLLEIVSCGGNLLNGTVPTSLGRLLAVVNLTLDNNRFEGSFPSVSLLTNLTVLRLNGNRFTHVPSFAVNTRLTEIALHANRLVGYAPNLPQSIVNCTLQGVSDTNCITCPTTTVCSCVGLTCSSGPPHPTTEPVSPLLTPQPMSATIVDNLSTALTTSASVAQATVSGVLVRAVDTQLIAGAAVGGSIGALIVIVAVVAVVAHTCKRRNQQVARDVRLQSEYGVLPTTQVVYDDVGDVRAGRTNESDRGQSSET